MKKFIVGTLFFASLTSFAQSNTSVAQKPNLKEAITSHEALLQDLEKSLDEAKESAGGKHKFFVSENTRQLLTFAGPAVGALSVVTIAERLSKKMLSTRVAAGLVAVAFAGVVVSSDAVAGRGEAGFIEATTKEIEDLRKAIHDNKRELAILKKQQERKEKSIARELQRLKQNNQQIVENEAKNSPDLANVNSTKQHRKD